MLAVSYCRGNRLKSNHLEVVKEKQRKWKAKLEQMSGDRLVKKVYMDEARGKRPWGQPRKRWQDNFT